MQRAVFSEQGPAPKGPYSPAVVATGPVVYISAQGPFDPTTGSITSSSFRDQARQAFDNVTALLEAAGATWHNAVKVQVFLADFANFAEMNEIYAEYVTEPYPARTTVHSRIGQAEIAVDCIAVLDEA
jgi:2-iminobutanoate/2-iminopropanoate deaminase